jgi:hypothetical protein
MNYAKPVKMSLIFTCRIFLEVGKTQDLLSKIWQTVRDAFRRMYLGVVGDILKKGKKLLERYFSPSC